MSGSPAGAGDATRFVEISPERGLGSTLGAVADPFLSARSASGSSDRLVVTQHLGDAVAQAGLAL